MKKPYPEFPLTAHRNGQWCKKINGKIHYFGRVENWKMALENLHSQIDYLRLGKTPPCKEIKLRDVLNRVIEDKKRLHAAKDIGDSHMHNIVLCASAVCDAAGNLADVDMGPLAWSEVRLTLSQRYAPTTLTLIVNLVNMMLKHAVGMSYLTELPKRGPGWIRASAKVTREHLAKNERVIPPTDFRGLLVSSTDRAKACILLGINCAFGPKDLSCFNPDQHIKSDGVVEMVRSKTGTFRQAVLWPETINAINGVFPLSMDSLQVSRIMCKAMSPFSCYDLRHTFATIGDQFTDSRAVDVVMGHSDGSVRATYRHGVDLERLRKLSEFVRNRIFGLSE